MTRRATGRVTDRAPGRGTGLPEGRATGLLAGHIADRAPGERAGLGAGLGAGLVAGRWILAGLLAGSLAGSLAGAARAQGAPLSSIDWLSDSLAGETVLRPVLRPLPRTPALAARGATVAPVTVSPLDAPAPDGAGLTGPDRSGLPPGLWGPTTTDAIAARLASLPGDPLPAARDALKQIVLARLDPPSGGGTPGALLLARLDTLLALGALDEAAALLDAAGTDRPELFRRAFDIALLQGREDAGCAKLRSSPGIAPSLPVRIFCLARSGDWPAAALTLETAAALGQLSSLEDALLARFLDPALAEGVPPLARLPAPTPLEWRMLEAIGERQPTTGLPRAFAHADLRETAGWKTRIEATERLVRAGALPVARLCTIYSERRAAASGGVWERVAAVRALEAALETGDNAAIGAALGRAWRHMTRAGLGLALAEMFAPRLAEADLSGKTARDAHRLALLSDRYEAAALAPPEGAARLPLVLARGGAASAPRGGVSGPAGAAPRDAVVAALERAFAEPRPEPNAEIAGLAAQGRLGEALIAALRIVADGAETDPDDLAGALAFLRTVGMEDTARRAALQIYLLGGRT